MPQLTPGAPYLLLLLAGLAFILMSAILAALLPLPLALIGAELLCLLLPAMLFRRAFAAPDGGWPGLVSTQPAWWIGLAVATTLAIGTTVNALGGLLAHLTPDLAAQAATYSQTTRALLLDGPVWRSVAAHLSVVVFAPLTEELLFRGAMLPAQRTKLGVMAACLVNGALFSAFHFNWLVLLPLTLLGAYLAWITARTRCIVPAILAHATMNGMSVAILHTQTAPPPPVAPLASLLPPLAAGAALSAALIFVLARTARTGDEAAARF